MNETLKVLTERRSVRSYKDAQVPEETLQQILTAGEYAPSGMGMQPVVMAVVQDKETIRQMSRMNAAVMGNDSDPFYGAPTVVVVFADSRRGTCVEDGSLVMGNLMNAAFSLGVDSCWIHRAREVFQTEEGKSPYEKMGTWRRIYRHRKLHPGLWRQTASSGETEKRRLCHPGITAGMQSKYMNL